MTGSYGPAQASPPPQYGGPGGVPPGRAGSSFGVVAAAFTAVGAVLGVLALTVVDWLDGSGDSKFSDIRRVVTADETKPYTTGFVRAYYGWLAWVLLGVVVVCALVAALPGVGAPFRAIGAVLALASIVATFVALKFFNSKASAIESDLDGYGAYLKHARFGFWMTVAAFLLAGIGALIGARRRA